MKDRYKVGSKTWIRIGLWLLLFLTFIAFLVFILIYLFKAFPTIPPWVFVAAAVVVSAVVGIAVKRHFNS